MADENTQFTIEQSALSMVRYLQDHDRAAPRDMMPDGFGVEAVALAVKRGWILLAHIRDLPVDEYRLTEKGILVNGEREKALLSIQEKARRKYPDKSTPEGMAEFVKNHPNDPDVITHKEAEPSPPMQLPDD